MEKNVHDNCFMGVMGWTKSESTLEQKLFCPNATEQILVKICIFCNLWCFHVSHSTKKYNLYL